MSLTSFALSINVSAGRLGCAPYGRHTLIRFAHPSGQPAAVTALRFVSLLAQERCAKEGHPDIRVSLRETSLAPAPFRGPAYKGRPWPFKPLAASMRLAPLHGTSTRPPDGTGARACEIFTGSSSAASVFAFSLELRSHRRHPIPLQEAEWNHHVRGRAGSHERHGCRESCDGRGRLGRDGPSERAPGVVMKRGNPGAVGRGRLARMVGCPSLWLLSLGQARATQRSEVTAAGWP